MSFKIRDLSCGNLQGGPSVVTLLRDDKWGLVFHAQARRSRLERSPAQKWRVGKIVPGRIGFLNQGDLFAATPLLDLLLAGDRVPDVLVTLKEHQPRHVIVTCESGYPAHLVLVNASYDIVRHSDIEHLRSTRHDVDIVASHTPQDTYRGGNVTFGLQQSSCAVENPSPNCHLESPLQRGERPLRSLTQPCGRSPVAAQPGLRQPSGLRQPCGRSLSRGATWVTATLWEIPSRGATWVTATLWEIPQSRRNLGYGNLVGGPSSATTRLHFVSPRLASAGMTNALFIRLVLPRAHLEHIVGIVLLFQCRQALEGLLREDGPHF